MSDVSTTFSPAQLEEVLRDRLGERVVAAVLAYDQLTLTLEPDALVEAARMCKEDPDLGFDFWEFNSGVDLGEEGFALVTHLYSTTHRHHIQLRIVCPGGREEPKAPSLTSVYRGADWSERETFDMFGIVFEGHPQLLPRILTVENFEGWPLRKDFLLSTREAKPWPGAKEPEEQTAGDTGEAAATTPSASPQSAEDKAAAAKEKAERARQKAAEMRKKKAGERAAAEQPPEGGDQAERAAAGGDVPEGTPDPSSSEAAAELAGSDVAKDAAAGAVGGDPAAGAPGDTPGTDQPVEDLEQEAKEGEGGAPAPSGAPGIEAEGRHGGAEAQSGAKPAAKTPGMDAEPEGGAFGLTDEQREDDDQ